MDLKKCGVYKYAESDEFEILLFGYAYDDGAVHVVDFMAGENLPSYVTADLTDPEVLKTAYNANFEITCISKQFIPLDAIQWSCTSVHALYLGMPGNLADLGKVVGLSADEQKMAGWALIKYFCMPCAPTKTNGNRTRNYPSHDPEKWAQFKEYCGRDVEAERKISNFIAKFPLPKSEQTLWSLDQRMNSTGIAVDEDLIQMAIKLDEESKSKLIAEAINLTGVANPNSRDQILNWLNTVQEEEVVDLTKKSIPALIEISNNKEVRRMLEIRQELAKTSVSKYQAMRRAVCKDGRIRGLTQFYGANRTGRWAGRLVQVQNLPQNKLKDLNAARNLVLDGDLDVLEMMFGNVPDTLSQLIRTAFVGPFVVVDFSAIEARVIAWMAGCMWRMDVFNSHGKIYEASAEQMFKLPEGSVDRKSPYRQKGKIAELALGYGGGAGALVTMGALAMGLTEKELEPIKVAWRTANPEIVELWHKCERAAIDAVIGKTSITLKVGCGTDLTFEYKSGFLFIRLPNGRSLSYVKPRIESVSLERNKFVIARAGSLTYEGIDQKTRHWDRVGTYGGKLVENITQAIARDCLAESMLKIDMLGYKQVTTVHDEIIIESQTGLDEIMGVMAAPIKWAPGLPLKGDGYITDYYMKEIE